MVDHILRFLIPERATIAAAVLMQCPMTRAENRWDAPRVVTRNCSGCHGIDGNSQPPYFPRLAGLNAAFAEQRIAEFRAEAPPPVDELFYRIIAAVAPGSGASRRETRINMIGIGHAIPEVETNAAAEWYAKQKPAPGRSDNPALIERGEELYLKGLLLRVCQLARRATEPRRKATGKFRDWPARMAVIFWASCKNSMQATANTRRR